MTQATFAAEFLDAFAGLRSHGFVPVRGTGMSERAAMIARPTEEVCVYVTGTTRTRMGAGADAWIWVAPPDFPDDSVDRLRVGLRIELDGKSPDESMSDYLAFIERRVNYLLPALPALYPVVVQELHDPFPSPRRQIYLEERRVVRWFHEHAGTPTGAPICRPLLAAVRQVAHQGRGLKAAQSLAIETLEKLRRIPEAWKELELTFGYSLSLNGKSDRLWGLLYIDELLPWPPGHRAPTKDAKSD